SADGPVSNVAVAVNGNGNDQFVVTWEGRGNPQDKSGSGVFARVFDRDGKPLTNEFRVNLKTAGSQGDPSVAWTSADQFVVTWTSATNADVFARIFAATGTPVSDDILVPQTHAGKQQQGEVISLPGGGFQVAWGGKRAGDPSGIFTRQFTSAGAPVGPEFRVNSATAATDSHPVMARDGNNQVVIAWQTAGN